MARKIRLMFLMAVLGLAWAATPVWAQLVPSFPIEPHGYPQYYTDDSGNGLSLELCLENATMCFFDPVIPGNEFSEANGFGPEAFWFLAEAEAATPPTPDRPDSDGRAILVLGLEAAFGGDEAVQDGNQVAFGRIRVRVDIDQPGTYRVIHPYNGTGNPLVFEDIPAGRRAINYTQDIGGVNPGNPGAAFSGAAASPITRFLTWPNYLTEPSLKITVPVLDENGDPVLDDQEQPVTRIQQYIGHPGVAHVVTGSPFNANYFRVERWVNDNWEVYAQTDLFAVYGREYSGIEGTQKTVYANVPEKNLLAVGPVNRGVSYSQDVFNVPSVADITPELFLGYPKGYPLWYQENLGSLEAPEPGLQLTLCPGGNPMCISFPVDPLDPGSREINMGPEAFWWSAFAEIDGVQGVTATLDLALEAAFGGDEALVDGNQVGFGRVRVRIDTPAAGDYIITHPYGAITFTNVPAGGGAINYTQDIGGVNPFDPDAAFDGALYSAIGPTFLVWPDFNNRSEEFLAANPLYEDLVQPLDPTAPPEESPLIQYVGNPAVPHVVTGGTNGNIFRVQGPGGIDVSTNLFAISGKVFDPATFEAMVPPETMPVANPDNATTIGMAPVEINVLANDTIGGELIANIPDVDVTVTITEQPLNGSAVVGGNNIVTYQAAAGFAGQVTFNYTVTHNVTSEVSAPATVTVTVLPVEDIGVTSARLDTRRMRWDIRGTGNETAEGVTLTVHQGSATGPVIGTATVNRGRWSLRATNTGAPPAGAVSIYVVTNTTNHGPFTVQAR